MLASIEFWAHTAFVGLWPLIWHFGLGGVIIIVSLVLYFVEPAWFPTKFRNLSLWIAVGTAIAMVAYGMGVVNEKSRCDLQNKAGVEASLSLGNTARNAAVQSVTHPIVPPRWVSAPKRDPLDRNKSGANPKRNVQPVATSKLR